MLKCNQCEKELCVGDEVHKVGDETFCSKECAVLYLSHEIAMNAKEMAIEQYEELAEILTVRSKSTTEECHHCHRDLSAFNTILAAIGNLYCSRACGIQHLEIKHNHTKEEAEKLIDTYGEEVTPSDIGIEKQGMSYDDIMKAFEDLAKSNGKYGRLYDNLMKDSEYRHYFVTDLADRHFKDVVDLVLYLEG